MSHEVMRNLMAACPLKGERRMLLMALAHHADDAGICFPSQVVLASECGLSVRGVRGMMQALIIAGEVEVLEKGHGRGNVSTYRLSRYVKEETESHKRGINGSPYRASEKRNPTALKEERGDIKEEAGALKEERHQRNLSPNTNRIPKEHHKNTNTGAPAVLPEGLDRDDFKTSWSEWLQYRSERKPKLPGYTAIGISKQLKKLAEMGADRAIAAIDHSIAQNYQGIYEPSGGNGQRNAKPIVPHNQKSQWGI